MRPAGQNPAVLRVDYHAFQLMALAGGGSEDGMLSESQVLRIELSGNRR